ncbi:hypothetical protein LWI28_015737 [Acer negundo]|uniref:TF-B3 domain-containing protein n=1 Tax=Acer negundo TaxID=4023 RepID=A0AAD5J1C0_ACENE|nr:hypothetical protein LWI28_015737 [Acer negundo]
MASSRRSEPISSNPLAESPFHFFKVILPATLEEKKLRIPEKFVRKFGDELSDVATLRVPNGQVWHVRLTKDGKKIWFHVGWHDFVKYHSICVGYFLVFKYGKNSNFDVLIFDMTACDIQYPYYCGGGLKNAENNFGSKRCKVEELDEIKTSDAIGDESEFKKAVCKVEISSCRTLNFFKVILPAIIEEKKLRLPGKFVRKFGDELSAVVTLTVPNGRTWRVQLTKDEKKFLFLHDGWHDFVKYHSICVGFFLVFKYGKNSSFRVLIFDQSACEIQYPIYHRGPNNDEQNSNQDKTKIDDSVEITGFTTPNSPSNSLKDKAVDECRRSSGKMDTVPSQLNKPTLGSVLGINKHGKCGASFETPKFKHPNNPDSSTQNELEEEIEEDTNFYGSASPRKRTMTAVAREREFNAARVFEPVNPFCRVVLRKSYLNRKGCLMYFPSSFAKMHLRGVSEIIKLQTTDGKQRIARCVYRGDSANLTQGWYEFVSENNLGEGDVCFFEVLKSSDIVLKVTVFRVLESDGQSKRCKIDVRNEKYNRTKFDDLKLLVSLEDMGISVSRTFKNNTAQKKERAFAAARSIKPKHPSFMVILWKDNMNYNRMHVPSAFGSKYFSKDSKVIKVQDSGGREWPLQLCWRRWFCIKGWEAFYREKNLHKGDICICELIRVNEPLLKVSIFKVNL